MTDLLVETRKDETVCEIEQECMRGREREADRPTADLHGLWVKKHTSFMHS